jgi:hypothetical protein
MNDARSQPPNVMDGSVGTLSCGRKSLFVATTMRSLLAIFTLVAGALAAPADGPQLILTNGHQDAKLQGSIVNTDVHSFEQAQDRGVIETNETIYTYLSQETRYAHGEVSVGHYSVSY